VDRTDYVTIGTASAMAGIPEQTVQQWIADGKVLAVAGDRGRLVRLLDVQRLVASEGPSPGKRAATGETKDARATATVAEDAAAVPAQVEHARATRGNRAATDEAKDSRAMATGAEDAAAVPAQVRHSQAIGDTRVSFMARLDELYRAQIAAKNREIAELRQRLERAERALAVARRAEAAREPAGVQPESETLTNSAMQAVIAKLDQLYVEQIAAKDDQIAAKDELIAELRQRAEHAERQAGMVWDHEALTEPSAGALRPHQTTLQRPIDEERSGEPAAVSMRQPAAREGPARQGRAPRALRHRRWVLIAPAVALILVGVVLSQVFARGTPTGTHGRAPRPTFPRFSPIVGLPLPVSAVLAQKVGLAGPRTAVPLPGGQIAVADTSNRRLVLLDRAGHLVASVRAGGLQQPVAVAAAPGALYVLDAARGAIERYDTAGRYRGEIIHAPALVGARDMALGQGGLLYVANPRANDIVVLSTQGKILYRLSSARGPGKDQFNAPADVAVGPDGNLYVADTANNRIKVLAPSGTVVAQWPAPPSTPQQPVQVLPLPDGRVLAADPAGNLLVYPPDGALPVFQRALAVPAGQRRAVGPSGLAPRAGGTMLVTDGRSNRVLVVRLPR
jgi:DNA-binding beta-propeller fold protein YncE